MTADNHASSRFGWPPMIYGFAAVISALLSWLIPVRFLAVTTSGTATIAGIVVIVAGVLTVAAAGRLFQRACTPVAPTKPSTALITGGIYRWIRNPMYLGLSLILLGVGVALGSLWFLVALPIAIFAVTKLAIEPEERYLAEKFGTVYLEYKSRVRRWGAL